VLVLILLCSCLYCCAHADRALLMLRVLFVVLKGGVPVLIVLWSCSSMLVVLSSC
jgi:hypothetical protein